MEEQEETEEEASKDKGVEGSPSKEKDKGVAGSSAEVAIVVGGDIGNWADEMESYEEDEEETLEQCASLLDQEKMQTVRRNKWEEVQRKKKATRERKIVTLTFRSAPCRTNPLRYLVVDMEFVEYSSTEVDRQ